MYNHLIKGGIKMRGITLDYIEALTLVEWGDKEDREKIHAIIR